MRQHLRAHVKMGVIMKDLRHLIYFEDLLRQANNVLVQQACKDGKLALGYNCSNIPELLLDVDGCFGVRLRAPGCNSPDMATYYMTNRSCPYSKSILERAFEGGYNFLSALIGQECCTTMNRMEQYFDYCKLIPNEKFFVECIDMPINRSDWHEGYYERQIQAKIIDPLVNVYNIDFSDEKLLKAIELHNEVSRIVTEIGNLRKLENAPITGYEFHIIQLVTLTCPKYLILDKLRETLAELKKRKPEPKPWYRARVMITGAEVDDPELTRMLEMCGGFVVADRYCFGSMPGREQISVDDGESPLHAIARYYLRSNQCPRTMGPENIISRKQYIFEKAREFGAEGIIVENMKFCEYWGYERAQDAVWLSQGYEIPGMLPTCQIERDYTSAASGQLRTRFQAFIESLEIKRIQSAADTTENENGGAA